MFTARMSCAVSHTQQNPAPCSAGSAYLHGEFVQMLQLSILLLHIKILSVRPTSGMNGSNDGDSLHQHAELKNCCVSTCLPELVRSVAVALYCHLATE